MSKKKKGKGKSKSVLTDIKLNVRMQKAKIVIAPVKEITMLHAWHIKTMDSTTYQKIIKHYGWDYCDHDRVRRFCPECKWDVPAYMRQGDPENVEIINNEHT